MREAPLRIDVWSDIACPWCYVGKRRLEAALADFDRPVQVVWRAFELDTTAPRVRDPALSYAARLAAKYGVPVPAAAEMIARMTATAAADGLDFRFDIIRPGNTFDAHRLLHLAGEQGCQDALKERLLRAYLSEGVAIGEPAALRPLAVEVGLEPNAVDALLAGDRCAEEVRADEAEAAALGIRGVPFFRIGARHAASGAQPAEVLQKALEAAWAEHAPPAVEGEVCGPEGCGPA